MLQRLAGCCSVAGIHDANATRQFTVHSVDSRAGLASRRKGAAWMVAAVGFTLLHTLWPFSQPTDKSRMSASYVSLLPSPADECAAVPRS